MADFNSSLPVRTEANGDVKIVVVDNTVTSQTLTVNADGSVNVTDNGGSLTVDATNLDIRDLVFATDKVDVSGSSVTVSATDLDIRNLSATQDNVAISDGTDTLAVNADGSINSVVTATNLDIRDLSHTQDSVKIGDGTDFLAIDASGNIGVTDAGGSLTVDATDLDIRDLTHVSDSVKIGDGTDLMAVNPDGSINVKITDTAPGTEVNDYDTTASVASGATDTHTYTSTGNFYLQQIEASASGKIKIEVQVNAVTKFVQFSSTASPNLSVILEQPILATTGQTVTVIRKNLDLLPQDVYSTISGYLA